MNAGIKKELQALVNEWLEQGEGYTQTELSRKTGVQKTYLSLIANGKYDDRHPSDQQWHKLQRFFKHTVHWNTPEYEQIIGACRRAQQEAIRVGVDGYTGLGKTYSLNRYAKQNTDVYLVMCRPSMGVRAFIMEVAKAVGIERPTGDVYSLECAIVDKVERNPRQALLIFDEAEYLKPKSWNSLKTLCDLLEGKIGIVVSGIIREQIEKLASRNKQGMPQIRRRFSHKWLSLPSISSAVVRKIAKDSGITDRHALDWLKTNVESYDALRAIIEDATAISSSTGEAVSSEMLMEIFA